MNLEIEKHEEFNPATAAVKSNVATRSSVARRNRSEQNPRLGNEEDDNLHLSNGEVSFIPQPIDFSEIFVAKWPNPLTNISISFGSSIKI